MYVLGSIGYIWVIINKQKQSIMRIITMVIIIASLNFTSCGSVDNKMNIKLDKLYQGMTISEFKRTVGNSTLVEMMDNYSCYKLKVSSAKFGAASGFVYSTRFIYFRNNKLYRIDEGVRATDLKVEIRKYNN